MSISVEHAQLLLATPDTISSAVAGVTKADLQPSGSAIALTSLMALTAAEFDVDGAVVALQWQQPGWVISVDAGLITIAPQQLDGRRAVPVITATPTIAGQNILFQLSGGVWEVPVDAGVPTINGQDVILEDNRYFVAGAPLLTPGTIVLSENAVVASAAPTIAGSNITLTWGQASVGVETASLDVDGQDVVLNKTWSLAVDSTALSPSGQSVLFDWVVPNTIVVGAAQLSAVGSSLNLARNIPVTSATISASGQSVGRGDATIVSPALISITPRDVDFQYSYVLGYAVTPAEFQALGADVVLYLGSGAPTRFRSDILKDHIQIAFSKPQTFKSSASGRIRG